MISQNEYSGNLMQAVAYEKPVAQDRLQGAKRFLPDSGGNP
jgi:hypothetical protein